MQNNVINRVLQGNYCSGQVSDATLAQSSELALIVRTPAVSSVFVSAMLTIRPSWEDTARIRLFTGPTVTVDGTSVPVVNHNQLDGIVGVVALIDATDSTITDDGTLLLDEQLAATGTGTLGAPWLLSPATDYLVRLENEAPGNAATSLNLEWWEASTVDYIRPPLDGRFY